MSSILEDIYNSLNIVAFSYEADQQFQLLSDMPDWLLFFLGHVENDSYPLFDSFAYLSCFKEDAELHWQEAKTEPLASGPWIEIDALEQSIAFEASALCSQGKRILLIQNLGKRYTQELERYQQVRNSLLTKEMLETEVQRRTLAIRRREEELAIKLVSLTSYRDQETGTHVRRIGLYAAAMAKALNWSEEQIDIIRIAAPMHDIGKIGIPDRVLRKNGSLNDAEFTVMKQHTEIGARMLSGSTIPVLQMAQVIARSHHERWDGTGYPEGLEGEAIPLPARITTIVDVYDALLHERIYKEAIPEYESVSMMRDMAGRYFDPELFKLFERLLPVMRQIRQEVSEFTG
ncbi:HD-GYP domain-containing protein [Thiolinea disciformis]|uniref:HD-GYP domain-containing protein n=1 Tax=Thiolinea disciformis TaxID=125614 RepID=UPI00036F37D4|nr:HD domain-containing phosphohydrolase [Thiolinea disciformis]